MSTIPQLSDSLTLMSHQLRFMVEGCRRLLDDVMGGMRINDPFCHEIEMVTAILRVAEQQAIAVDNIIDEIANEISKT